MRTTLDLNNTLLMQALKWTGQPTKTAAINEALRQAIQAGKRARLIELAGKVKLPVDINRTRKRK
ncbi:MAG: type II toxin-antitoxin system VapB family antitoxin [Candidatus Margulisbacteria bacterium]|jgi:Arc/MetJ family transcription regulator|nr:type II toxin-antitoxin system VapB family antitoxin [Candidatus Margulisiibacteriota bacterium]